MKPLEVFLGLCGSLKVADVDALFHSNTFACSSSRQSLYTDLRFARYNRSVWDFR
jgi:hypothetical protein